jgi:LmbE family N-acetylglucosaminyl deacetylase
MSEFNWRAAWRRPLRQVLQRTRSELDAAALRRSAIVFAPHQDDETLGCGGTIIRKRRAGAEVWVVFLTDGSGSHRHLMAEEELRTLREQEAAAAARLLEVEADHVIFLRFKDGQLTQQQSAAVLAVTQVLEHLEPEALFIPYRREAPADHAATYAIVQAALARTGRNGIEVYEYPVWFWQHWPWMRVPLRRRREALGALARSLRANWALLHEFRCGVDIQDVLMLKQTALDAHRSQMTRLQPDQRWLTLGDVSDGEFLDCFFQAREIFRRTCVAARPTIAVPSG